MLLLIDGDVLAYQACKARWDKTSSVVDDTVVVHYGMDGKRIPIEFTKEEDQAYLMECWENFQRGLESIKGKFFSNNFLMAVKGEGNFRNLMYPEYKLNRHADPTKQNAFVPVLRKLAAKQDLAVESDGREADDLLRIWAEEAIAAGDPYVVCSIDKDLKCIHGKHYLMHKQEIIDVDQDYSTRFYYSQLLSGDPTDNIPGVPRVGPVKASKLISNCKTESEMQEAVVDAYIGAYEDDWYNMLLSNGKMIYLQKDINDYFKISHWDVVRELRG